MKKNNLFIIIVVLVVAVFGVLLYWLNTAKKEINPEHIKLNFIVHNFSVIPTNENNFKENFIKPLLKSHFVINKDSREELFITSITNDNLTYCIPALGINYLRYSKDSPLNKSNYTSTARENDESSFFENWKGGESFVNLLKSIMKPKKAFNILDFNSIMLQNKRGFIDSLIVCTECSDSFIKENEPLIYKNTSDLRKFVNQQLEIFSKQGSLQFITKSIHIFTFSGKIEAYKNGTKNIDFDGDGVTDDIDQCPKEKGLKDLKGCPDDDGDKVPNNVDQCPKEKGEIKCSGCPCIIVTCPTGDKDRDGICDDKDNCPNDYGQKKYGGCPPDSDGDGIWDKFDKCPFEMGLKKFQGCPDTDGDGIPDYQDKCPREYGEINCNGCKCNDDISISLSGSKFQITGVTIGGEYTAKLVAKGQFKTKEFSFNGAFCPANTSESKSMSKQIDTDDLTVTIVVFKNGKEIYRKSFSGLSYVCFSNNDCGFLKD